MAAAGALALSACSFTPVTGQAYWQRVEDDSALYMTGPKAQQTLDENIAGCVREVDELVTLNALRKKMPPDTHSEYHRALDASGDLAYYDTPTRYGTKHVAHKDFQDFESCMRSKGWERVRFTRYQTKLRAENTYEETQQIRGWGGVPGGNMSGVRKQQEQVQQERGDFEDNNN
jgi:hypothetical protein